MVAAAAVGDDVVAVAAVGTVVMVVAAVVVTAVDVILPEGDLASVVDVADGSRVLVELVDEEADEGVDEETGVAVGVGVDVVVGVEADVVVDEDGGDDGAEPGEEVAAGAGVVGVAGMGEAPDYCWSLEFVGTTSCNQ